MSAISLKSISGITSITTPAGVDNQFTLHNNNTTEAVKLDTAGNFHFHNHLNITGISTAANFKTGTSNLHSTGLNIFDLDVDGQTNLDHVSVAGITTFNNNVHLLDNDYIRFGSSQDLSIFHDGTNNWFWSGGGHPTIHESSGSWTLRSVANQNYIIATENNSVDLYYSGTKRFETTSTGASVTGNFGASGNISLSGSFIMPDSLLHANDTTTRIRFPGPGTFAVDTSGNEVLRIASDANVRIIDGDLRVDTTGKGIIFGIEGGSNRPSIKGNYSSSSDNNMVFNTTGEERLRITGAGNVGINTSIPSATLEVSDIGSTGPLLLLNGASSTEGDICVDHDENLQIGHWNKSTSTFTERLSIPSSGYVQGNINVPCFFGEQDTAHSITNATWTKLVNFGNEPVNIGGAFTESTGVFTVGTGQAGTYVFYGGVGIDDIQDADYVEIVFVKNGSQIGPYSRTHCSAANHLTDAQLTFICSMSEGNTMELHIRHSEGSTEPTEPNRCFFGGYRLAV